MSFYPLSICSPKEEHQFMLVHIRLLGMRVLPVISFFIFLSLWEISVRLFAVDVLILPSPIIIMQQLCESGIELVVHTVASIKLTCIGFTTGAFIGLFVAWMLHMFAWLKRLLYPFIIISQNIPTIALLPLLMIWFGFGLFPKVITIVLVCFFPVCISVLDGFSQVDRTMLNYMRMIGANKMQRFWKLELPHALPAIFSGLKIAGAYSVTGTMTSEWIGTDKGIGFYMILQKAAYRTDRVFVAIVIVILLSLAIIGIICGLERLFIRWRIDVDHHH